MDSQRTCPSCGKPVSADAPQGLCPECLMKAGMGSTAGGGQTGPGGFVPPSVHEIAKLFPQLEVLELLGHGGMGAVYKARQPALDRLVALKVLPPRPGQDAGFADRFTREARALAKLSHPNIVAVYDFGQAGGLHFFIMEYVNGPNLRQVEQSGRLTPSEALKIIPQVCEALQFAHDEGIVHRDIKPENVLLDKKGRVKIADFGLAKLLGQEAQRYRLTGTKDVMGTPHYMAPEQVERPQEVDHRADIYSLGVVFYEMLTGELPLGRFGPPSSRSKEVQIDVRLDEVVLRALEREPERRYQQASEVKTDLESISRPPVALGITGSASPSSEQDRRQKEVRAPAIGLLVTGLFNWLVLPMAMYFVVPVLGWRYNDSGAKLAVPLLLASPFVLCSFVIYAALKMMRLEAYGAAIGASIVAMLVTPGNIIGFPVGIWALLTLGRREIKESFARVRAQQRGGSLNRGGGTWRALWIWGGVAVALCVICFSIWWRGSRSSLLEPASAPRVLFGTTNLNPAPISQDLVRSDGAWEASCTSTQSLPLFEIRDPGVENCVLIYEAKLKTEQMAGHAYLEMWCQVPGQGESFSRGLNNARSGSTDWGTAQTPFFLKKGEKPDLIRLNLVVEGPGKAFIKDIRLAAAERRP